MRWIYISPHFDDAVLSCGGLIWEQVRAGEQVEIWTICAGYPPPGGLSAFAKQLHKDWDTGTAAETIRLRRKEDRTAAGIVGAKLRHLPLPDCIYRRSPEGESYYPEDVFVPPQAGDAAVFVPQIERRLRSLARPADRLVCPLSVGSHVDHRLTRHAVERLELPIQYYGDLPYALRNPGQLADLTGGLTPTIQFVSEPGLAAWQEGVAAYASQLAGLFEDEEDMRESIRDFWQVRQGITLWQPESNHLAFEIEL